jgi:hypothetical protein
MNFIRALFLSTAAILVLLAAIILPLLSTHEASADKCININNQSNMCITKQASNNHHN